MRLSSWIGRTRALMALGIVSSALIVFDERPALAEITGTYEAPAESAVPESETTEEAAPIAPAEPSSAARRPWIAPIASPNRVAIELGLGFVPQASHWPLIGVELDHESGFIARANFAIDASDPYLPREAFGLLALGYRWRGLFELGLAGIAAAGPELRFLSWGSSAEPRAWVGGLGVYSSIGSPEGLRLTVTAANVLIGDFGRGMGARAYALPYEVQVPVYAHPRERARLFIVNRGFFVFPDPSIFTHRIELHALIVSRFRFFGGAHFDNQGIGGIFGVGGRFGSAPPAPSTPS